MTLRSLTAAALLVASTCVFAAAPASTGNLREALDHTPASMLLAHTPITMQFVDIGVVRSFVRDPAGRSPSGLDGAHLKRSVVAFDILPLLKLQQSGERAWNTKAGIPLADVRYFAGFGLEPHTVSLWGLAGERQGDDLMAHLKAHGFAPLIWFSPGTLANGPPMETNLARMDAADPWRGLMGQATVVARRDNVLLQASSRVPLDEASSSSTLQVPDVATALLGLEGRGAIARALLVSPTLGLEGLDPATQILTPGLDAQALQAAIEARASDGLPPYTAGLIADLQIAGHPALALSLAYPDCASAGLAAQALAARWLADMAWAAQAPRIRIGTAEGDDGCAAVTVIGEAAAARPTADNPLFDATLRAIVNRSFHVLRIRLHAP